MRERTIRIALSVLMTFSILTAGLCTSAASVQADIIQPRYTGIATIAVGLSIGTLGRADCYGQVNSYTGYTSDMTLILQRSSDGSVWSTVKTWTASGDDIFSIDESYYVSSGYDYRVKVTVKTYNSSGTLTDSVTKYSSTKSY